MVTFCITAACHNSNPLNELSPVKPRAFSSSVTAPCCWTTARTTASLSEKCRYSWDLLTPAVARTSSRVVAATPRVDINPTAAPTIARALLPCAQSTAPVRGLGRPYATPSDYRDQALRHVLRSTGHYKGHRRAPCLGQARALTLIRDLSPCPPEPNWTNRPVRQLQKGSMHERASIVARSNRPRMSPLQ